MSTTHFSQMAVSKLDKQLESWILDPELIAALRDRWALQENLILFSLQELLTQVLSPANVGRTQDCAVFLPGMNAQICLFASHWTICVYIGNLWFTWKKSLCSVSSPDDQEKQ